ncbi:hypothetical protein BASA81_016515 [Batrachochytrium salamandrivorans]|nr:hypothetical protein BASA81_016515 [Batrachochytrium salamandrivorans]
MRSLVGKFRSAPLAPPATTDAHQALYDFAPQAAGELELNRGDLVRLCRTWGTDGPRQGKRTCRHYLHVKCAEMLINSGHNNCPTCRAKFDSLEPVPNLETDPRRWFQLVDFDGNGQLSKSEVLDLVKTFLGGMEVSKLEQEFDLFWRRWDRNGDGEISFAELCDPNTGLMADFKHKFQRPTGFKQLGESPKLSVGAMVQWFEYWDQDGNGSLDKDEVIRALIKTFSLSSDLYKVNELRDTVNNIWGAFDFDGSGNLPARVCTEGGGAGGIPRGQL